MIFTRRVNNRVPDTDPVYLTKEGLDNLKKHLARLKESLPRLIDETQRAAAFGDRSDSAEYSEAKGALRRTHSQIESAEDKLKRAVLIDPTKNPGIVQIGSTVTVESNGTQRTFQIVGSVETSPGTGRISNRSPLGAALLNKKIGDKISVETPAGNKEYKIIKVV